MTPHKQRFRHRPEIGIFGDCHRTAIASLLDLDPESVPHFLHDDCGTPEFNRRVAEFLREQGLVEISQAFDCSLELVLATQATLQPNVYYLLAGSSRNGTNHTVIGCSDRIVWDPSLDDTGIVGPGSDGRYWVSYLVPLRFERKAA